MLAGNAIRLKPNHATYFLERGLLTFFCKLNRFSSYSCPYASSYALCSSCIVSGRRRTQKRGMKACHTSQEGRLELVAEKREYFRRMDGRICKGRVRYHPGDGRGAVKVPFRISWDLGLRRKM